MGIFTSASIAHSLINFLCAHTLATACERNEFERMLAFVELPLENLSGLTSSQQTVQPGKKLNEKNKKVRRPFSRNIEKYTDLSFDNDEQDEALCMETFEVIFIQTTKSTTCYGCSEKWRACSNGTPPPPPYDIILRRKERRCFKARGSIKVQISAKPEFVY